MCLEEDHDQARADKCNRVWSISSEEDVIYEDHAMTVPATQELVHKSQKPRIYQYFS